MNGSIHFFKAFNVKGRAHVPQEIIMAIYTIVIYTIVAKCAHIGLIHPIRKNLLGVSCRIPFSRVRFSCILFFCNSNSRIATNEMSHFNRTCHSERTRFEDLQITVRPLTTISKHLVFKKAPIDDSTPCYEAYEVVCRPILTWQC